MVIEGSISKILRSNEFSSMHPNAVFGTIQALAVDGESNPGSLLPEPWPKK